VGLVEFDHGLTQRRHVKMFFHVGLSYATTPQPRGL